MDQVDVDRDEAWTLLGPSLNGIGGRYALADYMDSNDVKTVVDALALERLVE